MAYCKKCDVQYLSEHLHSCGPGVAAPIQPIQHYSEDVAAVRITKLERENAELRRDYDNLIEQLCGINDHLGSVLDENAELREALEFYAEPHTYFAICFLPDPPCGDFMEDFGDTPELGRKPGERARTALRHADRRDRDDEPVSQ